MVSMKPQRESVAGWGQSGACLTYFKKDVANEQQAQ